MTMVSTGTISLAGTATSGGLNQSVQVELGGNGTTTISLNDTNVRTLAGVASGAISLSAFYGKANQFAFTLTSSAAANLDLRTQALAAGWNGTSKVVATNNGTIYSSSTGSAALTISGSFPNGVQLINNSIIVGCGGIGGNGASQTPATARVATAGAGGGVALVVSTAVTITNNGTVGGGGGGGGGGAALKYYTPSISYLNGGGGGGGIGYGGGGTAFAGSGAAVYVNAVVGSAGSNTSAGGGGAGAYSTGAGRNGGAGGTGGSYGSAGATGNPPNNSAGGVVFAAAAGGAAGACTSGNVNITWAVTGNRYGALN